MCPPAASSSISRPGARGAPIGDELDVPARESPRASAAATRRAPMHPVGRWQVTSDRAWVADTEARDGGRDGPVPIKETATPDGRWPARPGSVPRRLTGRWPARPGSVPRRDVELRCSRQPAGARATPLASARRHPATLLASARRRPGHPARVRPATPLASAAGTARRMSRRRGPRRRCRPDPAPGRAKVARDAERRDGRHAGLGQSIVK
jgi:hypothetical protein